MSVGLRRRVRVTSRCCMRLRELRLTILSGFITIIMQVDRDNLSTVLPLILKHIELADFVSFDC